MDRKQLARLAAACDRDAQCKLAESYDFDPPKDRRRAEYWYRRAALREQGDSWAQYLLSRCYRDGQGVERNRRWAQYWLAKHERGLPEASNGS